MKNLLSDNSEKGMFLKGLLVGCLWPSFIFLCALIYSVFQMEGIQFSHHLQNATSIFTMITFGVMFVGCGVGFMMFFSIEDNPTGYRFLGYMVPVVPIVIATFAFGGIDFYEPPREEADGLRIEIELPKVLDWWNDRDKDD